ncbi:MAG: hypothetical protein NTW64_03990 [Candidatus Omnitrophica bacterium]|nr:hypothetical protein [Candidatus Omnitrophota bacterium]
MKGENVERLFKLTVIIFMFVLVCVNSNLSAGDTSGGEQQGRFILVLSNTGETKNAIIPAMVLDSYKGIVWTCHNLQDARSSWIKTDLGQNGDKPLIKIKYCAKMIEGANTDAMLAIVCDNDEGIIWICPNIIDNKSIWMKKDLKAVLPEGQETTKK